jgi:hypothetical protein
MRKIYAVVVLQLLIVLTVLPSCGNVEESKVEVRPGAVIFERLIPIAESYLILDRSADITQLDSLSFMWRYASSQENVFKLKRGRSLGYYYIEGFGEAIAFSSSGAELSIVTQYTNGYRIYDEKRGDDETWFESEVIWSSSAEELLLFKYRQDAVIGFYRVEVEGQDAVEWLGSAPIHATRYYDFKNELLLSDASYTNDANHGFLFGFAALETPLTNWSYTITNPVVQSDSTIRCYFNHSDGKEGFYMEVQEVPSFIFMKPQSNRAPEEALYIPMGSILYHIDYSTLETKQILSLDICDELLIAYDSKTFRITNVYGLGRETEFGYGWWSNVLVSGATYVEFKEALFKYERGE